MITNQILAKVEPQRLLKATEGLVSGAYRITVISQTDSEIRGFVANGDGQEYGVGIGEYTFCSCRDSMYRKGICKHVVALALFVIRTPQAATKVQTEAKEASQPVTLPKLVKVREGFAFAY